MNGPQFWNSVVHKPKLGYDIIAGDTAVLGKWSYPPIGYVGFRWCWTWAIPGYSEQWIKTMKCVRVGEWK